MAQWGATDDAANSVNWAPAQLKLPANTDNQANLYANVTANAFGINSKIGQVGVSVAEVQVESGGLAVATVTFPGSGYSANASVTVSGNGTANALANSTGRISAVLIVDANTGYTASPTVTIDPPTAKTFNANTGLYMDGTFNANTGVDNATEFITVSSNPFVNDDIVQYLVAAGNTAVTGLANATLYYVVSANSTGLKLATSANGTAINVTASATSETGHTLRRFGFVEISSSVFQDNDIVTYLVAAGNTALTGLSNNTQYSVTGANSSGFYPAYTANGARVAANGSVTYLVPGVSETGHSFTGETATASISIAGGRKKGALPGWNLRTEGVGRRAGRVHYECLVAMSSISGGDDSDDTLLPDT